jgi:hypothetical protein
MPTRMNIVDNLLQEEKKVLGNFVGQKESLMKVNLKTIGGQVIPFFLISTFKLWYTEQL